MSLLVFLAQAPAQGVEPNMMDKFGLEPKYILFQLISFVILFYVFYRFGIKPTLATMDVRRKKIEDGIRYTEEMKAKLDAAQKATEAQLKEAQLKGQQIVAESQKAAKEFSEKQQQEAVEKAEGIIVKAQAAIELEKTKMLAEARTEVARLVVATTQRVLAKELSELERARFNEAAARELTKV